ncbi:hypothetical protein [Pseudomonas tohonis]|uniref:hypothetical protein n=1 Tax=Pseudomonas tohonis TaxID=2725477 RepID=UPI001F291AB0|nr:hypothetical protein [Pseudomonas tohonis]
MSIHVNGNGNRVAGRDYIENRGPRPCPICEVRLIEEHRDMCRHCFEELQRKEADDRLRLWGWSIFIMTGVYLQFRTRHGATASIELLVESVVAGAAIVFFIYLLYHVILEWLRRH